MRPIRNSAKAVIIREGSLLLTKNKDQTGIFYLFPGGGQEAGEELRHTVVRECLEEIGQEVVVDDLINVREYIGKNHQFPMDAELHQVEFYFRCTLKNPNGEITNGLNPDDHQIGVEWIELDRLDHITLYPKGLGELIKNRRELPRYLGDCN